MRRAIYPFPSAIATNGLPACTLRLETGYCTTRSPTVIFAIETRVVPCPSRSAMANVRGGAEQEIQTMEPCTNEVPGHTRDTDLPGMSVEDLPVATRPPLSALQQRRATLSARRRSTCRRQSVLHQELELLSKLREQEAHNDEELELGRALDAPEDLQSAQHGNRQQQGEDKGRGGSDNGGRIPSRASQKLSESDKLEDQINLQHLIELMRIFHVSTLRVYVELNSCRQSLTLRTQSLFFCSFLRYINIIYNQCTDVYMENKTLDIL